jgi:hypothetical protein
VHPEVDELKPKLKEILYDCAVEIRATKAALYLLDPDLRKFELVTDFGFRGGVRQAAGFNDPLIDRCQRGRVPFFVNSVAADPRLSELLFQGSTQKLMAVPLYSRGQLVGFIDMRDKAAQALFEQGDVVKAQGIADRILTVFASKNIFNQRFITLSDTEEVERKKAPDKVPVMPVYAPMTLDDLPKVSSDPNDNRKTLVKPMPVTAPQRVIAPEPVVDPSAVTAKTSSIITKARLAAARIIVPSVPPSVGEPEIALIRDVLRAVLYLPGVVLAAVSATGTAGGIQEISAKGPLKPEGADALQSKLQNWLSKRGESTGKLRTNVTTPLGAAMPEVAANHLVKVFTAPVMSSSVRGLYFTVAFTETPDRSTHELLTALLTSLEIAIDHSLNRSTITNMRNRMAEELLEPQFSGYPELRRHTESVAGRSEQFARFIGLSPEDVETTRLVAMVHDVGMRVLNYDKLYRKRDLTAEELALLREHPSVGAAMIEPLLGVDVARAVLAHHERFDGGGYPNELRGENIPMPSRIVAICDAYVVMTDPSSYHAVVSHPDALAAITRGAGGQFDPELAVRFAELMANA